MRINIQLSNITQDDTIILANNRQALAFKKTWGSQKTNSALPKILPWQQYLEKTWRSLKPNTSKRLISNIESRLLIKQSMQALGQKVDTHLLDEVVKNNNYCYAYLIDYSQLLESGNQTSKVFAKWLKHYQKTKLAHNLLDHNDLANYIIKHHAKVSKPYIYGFKTLTPVQALLFDKVGYQILKPKTTTEKSNCQAFQNTQDELLAAAHWAKHLNFKNPNKQIAIVCPELSSNHHQIRSIFDQVFSNALVETGDKSYNISLGFSLTQYPLVRHILMLLELCKQLQNNRIETQTFNTAITSPYIAGAKKEKFSRALLVNHVLKLSKTQFKFAHLKKYLEATPKLKALLEKIIAQTPKTRTTHDQWLLIFEHYLQILGFATDRTLSSTEYQLFNKYQQSSLGLNQLAHTKTKIDIVCATDDLKDWLSQVIFQAQSAKTPIQILGSLEAEGLYFDNAWVLGMTDDFLPERLNPPRFISNSLAMKQQIPKTNFDLINDDAKKTLDNLNQLSNEVIFSYAKTNFEKAQKPSPLVRFQHEKPALKRRYQSVKLENINDVKVKPLKNKQINAGVSVLKSQTACAFSGFAHRLNIQSIDDPQIGLNKMDQGRIIHDVLQHFYQEISSQEALLLLTQEKLSTLINEKINIATKYYYSTGFIENEKKRISAILYKLIEIDKQRPSFEVLSTEKSVDIDIAGLKFTVRLDRLDKTKTGDEIIYDYKIGNPSINHWCGDTITEPQLPIYAISNNIQGIAFIQLNANKVSIKGLAKNTDSLPKQSGKHACQTWDKQIIDWETMLNSASQDFQHGNAQVLPNKTACQYCEFDSLCRIEK